MNRIDAKNQKKDGWMIYSLVFDVVLKIITDVFRTQFLCNLII